MAERQTRTNDPLSRFAGGQDEYNEAGVPAGQQMMPVQQGQTAISIFGGAISAQRVAVKRNLIEVKQRLAALAAEFGADAWIYRWEVNNRSTGRKDTIEGGTIKLANDLAREWGNCQVDIRVVDEGAHWLFYGRFVDLETGYSLTRPYQQRKSMNTGMKDQQRAMDMIMQIGTSKCIRNVVLNALQALVPWCLDTADQGVLERVKKSPDKARAWILAELDKMGVEIKRVERVMTVSAANFTVPMMARLFSEIRSVTDGMIMADDIWPSDETLKQRATEDKYNEKESASATSKPKVDAPEKAKAETPPPDEPRGDTDADEQQEAPATAEAPLVEIPYTVKNEQGVTVGSMETAPELGAEMEYHGVQVRVVEVTEEPRIVVVRPVPVAKPTAAEKAAEAAKKAGAAKTPAKAAPKVNLFGDD